MKQLLDVTVAWFLTMSSNPRKTPSTSGVRKVDPAAKFLPDPFMDQLFRARNEGQEEPPRFALVIAAGWPPDDNSLEVPYQDFTDKVKACFVPPDFVAAPNESACPPVFLYPRESLHITVATMQSLAMDTKSEEQRLKLYSDWKGVLERASSRPAWPKKSLQVRIKSAEIGTSNGILLWEELTGGLHAMRHCVSEEVEDFREAFVAASLDVTSFTIPPFVHSTFLRFARVPKTPRTEVQSSFQNTALPFLGDIFPDNYNVNIIKFACEQRPHMDIPYFGSINLPIL